MIGLSIGEQAVEVAVGQAVRVLGVRRELEQVDDVDEADLQVRELLAEQRRRRPAPPSSGCRRRRPSPRPARRPGRCSPCAQMPMPLVQWAIASSMRHVLQVLLLVGDDDVDVVRAPQAVVRDATAASSRPAAGRCGRRPGSCSPRRRGSPGSWCVNPLWSCRQTVEVMSRFSDETGARHGSCVADGQPLGVLVEHRVDDVGERLVGARRTRGGRSAGSLRASLPACARESISMTRPSGRELAAVGVLGEVLGEPELLADTS